MDYQCGAPADKVIFIKKSELESPSNKKSKTIRVNKHQVAKAKAIGFIQIVYTLSLIIHNSLHRSALFLCQFKIDNIACIHIRIEDEALFSEAIIDYHSYCIRRHFP